MQSCSTPVPYASSKGRSETVETSLPMMRDLQALSARDLSVKRVEIKPDRGQEDASVLGHQQSYCRYASSNSSKPSNSWRAHTRLHENALPPAEQSFRHITAQQCPKLPSPFQATTDSDVLPESFSSNHVALNESPSASLAWDLCTHSLTTSLNDSTDVQYNETSLLSSTVSRGHHYYNQQQSSISKHASAPVLPTPQHLDLLRLDPVPSYVSDTLSFQTSPSLSLPEQPCVSAASQSAIKPVDDSSTVLKEIRLQIVSAPAMFAQPIGINKPISPPFQAKVDVCTEVPIKFHARLVAYLLTSDQILKLQQWDPAAHLHTEGIVGGVSAATIVCTDKDVSESDGMYSFKGSSVLTFRDMKFATSSRMRPRWLVLALTLPNEDVLFVHYKVPTIIMSRACDQLEKAEAILKGQLPSRKRSRSLDVEDSRVSDTDVITRPQPPQLVTSLSPTQHSQLSLSNASPRSAHSLEARSQPASPSTPSRLRTHSSGLRVQSQVSSSVYQQSMAEPARHLVYPSGSVSLIQAMRSAALPSRTQSSHSMAQSPQQTTLGSQGVSQSSEPRILPQLAQHALPEEDAWSAQQGFTQMSFCQSDMISALLSDGGLDPLSAQHDLQPSSPSHSDLFASLFLPHDDEAPLSCSPGIVFPPELYSSPDSQLSDQSCGTNPLDQSLPMHCTQDSLQEPRDSCLSSTWPASTADQSTQSHESSMHDSDLAMLQEAIAAAAQHQAPSQHSVLMPQHPGLTLPLSQPGSHVKLASQSHLDPRLKVQSSQRKIQSSGLRSVRTETLSWPTCGPYNIQRWQSVLEQLYKSCNLARPLTMQDVWVLGQVAGFHSDPILLDTECLSAHQWIDFGDWFISQLGLLRRHQTMWDRQDPVVLCSFEVDRGQCEHLLFGQLPGTFLIRPSISLTGCMVVSTVAENGSVKHLCLDNKQLYSRPLEVWVRDAVEAQFFLDYRTGRVWHKEQVFLMQYRRFGVDAVPQQTQTKNAAQHTHSNLSSLAV